MANPVVTFEMENGDIIKAELYPEIAPNTVNNFISLVKKGFYDGLIFHRVISGFTIQGGDLVARGAYEGAAAQPVADAVTAADTVHFHQHLQHAELLAAQERPVGIESLAQCFVVNIFGGHFFILSLCSL